MKNKTLKKSFIPVFTLLLLAVPSLLFGADEGFASFFTTFKELLSNISEIIPLLVKLGLMLFAVVCLFVIPYASYMLSFRYNKKQDERNDTDSSGAMTHAKSASMALVGLLGGLILFHFVTIIGLDLGTVVGGGFGKVLVAILSLNLPS